MDQELGEKLDTIIGLISLAFAEPIQRARTALLSDPVKAAVLEALGPAPMDAGALQAAVSAVTRQSERTVGRRLSELVAQGVVLRLGAGPKVRYRLSGLMAGPSTGGGSGTSRG